MSTTWKVALDYSEVGVGMIIDITFKAPEDAPEETLVDIARIFVEKTSFKNQPFTVEEVADLGE
jgi:hypothetical protein